MIQYNKMINNNNNSLNKPIYLVHNNNSQLIHNKQLNHPKLLKMKFAFQIQLNKNIEE